MADNKEKKYTGGLDRTLFREWLEKLQQESWQLELIISGFVLYGVYNSKGLITDLQNYIAEAGNNIFLSALENLVTIGWRIFFINLLLHVILRSLWIGAIGLRYVSGEIEYDKLNYSEYFTRYLRKKVGDYDDFIERLEKICSVLFSYTFLLFLFFVSALAFGIFSLVPVIIADALGYDVEKAIMYAMIWILPYILGGAIVFVDFVTLGGIKRIQDNTISKIFMPLYWFYSHVTLSFLYRPLLYNFIDDKYTRRLFFFSFPYIFIIANFDGFYSNQQAPFFPKYNSLREQGLIVNPFFYDDLYMARLESNEPEERRDNKELGHLRLSQYKVTEPYLQLFIKYNKKYENVMEEKYGIMPIFKSGWKFTLFSDIGKERDSTLVALKDSFKIYERVVYEEYKVLRDSVKQISDNQVLKDKISVKRDSLKSLRKVLTNKRNKTLTEFELKKEKRILGVLQKQASIKIDNISYDDSLSCYFSVHHLQGHQGVVYNIPMSHVSIGEHNVEIDLIRRYIEEKDSIVTERYILPILKVN